MALECPLIDIAQIAPADLAGQADGAVRLHPAIGAGEGSSTAAYHAVVAPGATLARHANEGCDEILLHIAGGGIAGQGGARLRVRAGHCRLIPRGSEQFFHNDSASEDAVIVGFHVGAPDAAARGRADRGVVAADDLVPNDTAPDGLVIHLDDVAPANMNAGDGWSITDFRMPIAGHNGAASTMFRARFFPGSVHKKHRHDNCEEIYFVISGEAMAGAGRDRVPLHAPASSTISPREPSTGCTIRASARRSRSSASISAPPAWMRPATPIWATSPKPISCRLDVGGLSVPRPSTSRR